MIRGVHWTKYLPMKWAALYFAVLNTEKVLIALYEKQRYDKRKRNKERYQPIFRLPSAGSLSKTLQWLGLSKIESRSPELHSGLPYRCQDPKIPSRAPIIAGVLAGNLIVTYRKLFMSQLLQLWPNALLRTCDIAMKDGPNVWAPATNVGYLKESLGS